MISRRRPSKRNDQGVVAIELTLVMPFIIALIFCSIALAGLYSTKSRVVGAARDGARAYALKKPSTYDPNTTDGITVTLVPGTACPKITDPTAPKIVTAEAKTTYTVSVPFVGEWKDIQVTEKAHMPCE